MNVESLHRYLHQYIGKYIRVQTENIYISYSEGIFSIKQAEIRRDAFKDFHVFAVPRAGFVGNITVKVPSLFSSNASVHIEMTDVLVIFTNYEHDWTPDRVNEGRMAVLRLMDRAFQLKHKRDQNSTSRKTASLFGNMKGRLVTYIRELVKRHLIIEIKDVQVLYEAEVRSAQPYYFGLSLGSVITTNPPLAEFYSDGCWMNERGTKDDEGSIVRANKIHLRRFHVFCNTKNVPSAITACDNLVTFNVDDPEAFSYSEVIKDFRRKRVLEVFRYAVMQIIRKLRGRVRERPAGYERDQFIIYPIEHCTLELIRSAPGEGRPQVDWYITLPLRINVSNSQVASFYRVQRSRALFVENTEKLLRRPKSPVKGHARAWWHYASMMVSPKCRASFKQNLKHRARLRELFLQARETGNQELLREVYLSLPYRVAAEYMMQKFAYSVAHTPDLDEPPRVETAVALAPEVGGDEVGPSRQLCVDISVEATLSVYEPKFGFAYFTWNKMMSSNVVFVLSIPRILINFAERDGNFVRAIKYLELDIPLITVASCIPMMAKLKQLAVVDKISVQYHSNESGACKQTKRTGSRSWLFIALGSVSITAYAPLMRELKFLFARDRAREVPKERFSRQKRLQLKTQRFLSKSDWRLSADISVGACTIVLVDEYSMADFACVRHETEAFSMKISSSHVAWNTNISIPWTTSMTLEKRSVFMPDTETNARRTREPAPLVNLTVASRREMQRLRDVITAGNAMHKLNHFGVWVKKYLRVVKLHQHHQEFLRYADSEDGRLRARALEILCIESVNIGMPPPSRRSSVVKTVMSPLFAKVVDSELTNFKHQTRILTIKVKGGKFYIFRAPTAQIAIWWRDGLKNEHIREVERDAMLKSKHSRNMTVIERKGSGDFPSMFSNSLVDTVKIKTHPPRKARKSTKRVSDEGPELLEKQSMSRPDQLILRPLRNQKSFLLQLRSWVSRKLAKQKD